MEVSQPLLLILQLVSCSAMTGLILVIQFLHYPSFFFIHESDFNQFHKNHTTRISFIVIPAMLIELVTAGLLLAKSTDQKLFTFNFVLVLATWASTFFLSVPAHNRLAVQKDNDVIDRLVFTNWPRTILWVFRLVMLLIYIIFFTHLVSP